MHDDLALLARARRLDPEALAEIHDRYYPEVFRFIAFRVSDYQTADDLTSEVFTRLLSALRDRSAPQKSVRGWLFSVASHVVTDHHRQTYRAPQVELDERLAAREAGPPELLEQMLDSDHLRKAVRALTPDQQAVIALRFGQGYSILETAAALGKTEGSIKQLQARALAMLARRLSADKDV